MQMLKVGSGCVNVRPAARVATKPSPILRHVQVCAKRREVDVEGYYFQEVFYSAGERIFKQQGFLKKDETSILLASIESQQHALMTLEMFAQHIKNRRDTETSKEDWHFRKRFYTQLCLKSLDIGAPDIVLRLFSDMNRYDIAGAYFARDMIKDLAKAGAGADILSRVADMVRCQRPPGDKGAKAALLAVVDVLKPRGGAPATQAVAALQAFKEQAALAVPIMEMAPPGMANVATAPSASMLATEATLPQELTQPAPASVVK